MSGNGSDQRSAWVIRVLGVTPGGRKAPLNGNGRLDWPALRAAFDAAVATVDGQIAALQSALRSSDDDTLEEIAEFGMNGITGNHRVPLLAAMMEMGSGDAAALQKSGPKLVSIAEQFKAFLDSDERIEVCDDNPFGVTVTIRATLGGALDQIATGLRRGAGA